MALSARTRRRLRSLLGPAGADELGGLPDYANTVTLEPTGLLAVNGEPQGQRVPSETGWTLVNIFLEAFVPANSFAFAKALLMDGSSGGYGRQVASGNYPPVIVDGSTTTCEYGFSITVPPGVPYAVMPGVFGDATIAWGWIDEIPL